MNRRTILPRFWRSERGATAVEFVLVLPVLVLLTIGVINASLMLYAVSTMHYATEDAARWCMINSSTCTTGTVNTYAVSRYAGPAMSPNFILASPATCAGEQVTGAANFTFVTGLASITVPIASTACHPFG